jgi:hypothetical protein
MIDFLSSIPQFGGGKKSHLDENPHPWSWSNIALGRLSYYFKEVRFTRNTIVYSEKDPCRYVYIVLEGEFELNKKVKLKLKDTQQYNH